MNFPSYHVTLFICMKYCWHHNPVRPGIWDIAVTTNGIIQNRLVLGNSTVDLRLMLNVNLNKEGLIYTSSKHVETVTFILK